MKWMEQLNQSMEYQLLEEYDIQTAEDIQNALKDFLGLQLKKWWKGLWKSPFYKTIGIVDGLLLYLDTFGECKRA